MKRPRVAQSFLRTRGSRVARLISALALLAGIVAASLPARAQPVAARVGVIPVIGAAPIFVAHGLGWTKEAGLDLTFTTFESGPNMIQALASETLIPPNLLRHR